MDESWFPGHMIKAYRKFKEHIKLVDLIFEVRDARIPWTGANMSLSKTAVNKKIILILSKEDQADKNMTDKWVEYFSSKGTMTFAVNSLNRKKNKVILSYLGELLEEKKKKLEAKGRRDAHLRAIVAGIPNVGKSSFMNFLSSGGRVKVGRKAGVTLGEQWLKIAEGIELLDTPGILPFSKKEEYYWKLALTGAISREKIMPDMILEKYFNEFPGEDLWKGVENLNDFLIMKGKEYSFYASGGVINMEKTARRFLEDLETGKIKRFTLDLPV